MIRLDKKGTACKGLAMLLSLCLMTGCGSVDNNKTNKSDASSGSDNVTVSDRTYNSAIEISTEGDYEYSPEEIMYLSALSATAYQKGKSYALFDVDKDEISELFIKDGDNIIAFKYDETNNVAAKNGDIEFDEQELEFVGDDQWVDGSVVGVTDVLADPGVNTDYYLSSNYDWLSDHKVHTEGQIVNDIDSLDVLVNENKEKMLADEDAYQGEDIRCLRDYLNVATDWEKRNSEGITPVKAYLDDIKGLSSISEVTSFITNPDRDPFSTMIEFNITLDEKDTSHWATEVSEAEFSVYPRVYQSSDESEINDIREGYSTAVKHVLGQVGFTDEEMNTILTEAYEVEDMLLPLAWQYDDENETSDEEKSDEFVPFDTACSTCTNYPLKEVLNAYNIKEGNVHIYFPEYMKKVDELYTEENLSKIKSYLLLRTAASAFEYLDVETLATYQGLEYDENNSEMIASICDSEDEMNKRMVLSSREILGVAEENAYMTYFVDDEVKADLEKLTEQIRDTFRNILENEDWMSDEGKAAAIEKLDNMTFSVMRPDTLIDSSYLKVDTSKSFLDIYANLLTNTKKHNGEFAGKERVKGDWRYDLRSEIATTEVNAFYYGSFNQFFVCSGFVSDSTYFVDMPMEEKLAKLGEIIGHELTHGFDPNGIAYDKDGNKVLNDSDPYGWMPEKDYEAFSQRADKLSLYFDNIRPLPYDACSGSIVWGEAAADIGGMTIGLEIAKSIDNFDYDKYFRAHSKLWVKQSTLMGEKTDIFGEHPLYHLRINTTVQQFDEFYNTYGITEDDYMYLPKEARVKIW